MGFSFPIAALKRGHHLHGIGGLGMLGASNIDSTTPVPGGTQLDFYSPRLGTVTTWTDSVDDIAKSITTALLQSGFFSAANARVIVSEKGWISDFLDVEVLVTTSRTLPSLMAIRDKILSAISNAGVDPADKGSFVSPGSAPVSAPSAVPNGSAASYGIESVFGYPGDDFSDFDVVFTDGTSGLFDAQGNYYSGTQDGVAEVGQLYADDGSSLIGYFVLLNNGIELYFDLNGSPTDNFIPDTATTTTPSGAPRVGGAFQVIPNSTPGSPKPNSQGYDWGKLLSGIGLGNLPLALGVSAGTAALIAGAGLYVFFNGLPTGGKRR